MTAATHLFVMVIFAKSVIASRTFVAPLFLISELVMICVDAGTFFTSFSVRVAVTTTASSVYSGRASSANASFPPRQHGSQYSSSQQLLSIDCSLVSHFYLLYKCYKTEQFPLSSLPYSLMRYNYDNHTSYFI